MEKKSLRYLFIILLVATLLGVFFRFAYLDLTRFEHEMARDLIVSEPILEGDFVIHGSLPWITSERQNTLGPLSYYLSALGLIFVKDTYYHPLAPIIIIALLDLLAAFFAYSMGKEFFGKPVGLLVAAFYLLAPWQVVHTATSYTPTSFLPFFVVLYFYSVFRVVVHREDVYIIPALISLALQLHFHLTPFLLLFTLVPIVLLFRRDISKKYVAIGCLLALLMLTPYLYYSLANDSLPLTFKFLMARDPSDFITAAPEAFGIPILFMSPYFGDFLLGEGVSLFENTLVNSYFLFITSLFVVLFVGGTLYLLYLLHKHLSSQFLRRKRFFVVLLRSLRDNTNIRKYGLLLVLFFFPIFMYALKSSNTTPHYYVFLFPLQIFIVCIFLGYLLKKWPVATLCLVVVLLLSNAVYLYSFHQFVDENDGTKGIYGLPYRDKMQVVDYVIADSSDTVKVSYYVDKKPLLESFNYLFALNGKPPEVTLIEDIDEFTEGYLILDRYSFYQAFAGEPISAEDNAAIDALEPMHFGRLEVVKKA